jgi:hypothetical protein
MVARQRMLAPPELSAQIFIRGVEYMREVRWRHQLRLMMLACLTAGAIGVLGAFGEPGPALAAPTGVTVVIHEGDTETQPSGAVCTFHFHFISDLDKAGGWEIRAGARNGPAVMDGLFDTTGVGADRVPDSGTLSLPDGHYVMVWDDESPIDKSFDRLPFDVACEAPTQPGGSEAPIASGGSEAPISSGGSEAPIASGGEEPTGSVLGVIGTPPPTPPETDTTLTSRTKSDLRVPLGFLALIAAAALIVSGRRKPARRS